MKDRVIIALASTLSVFAFACSSSNNNDTGTTGGQDAATGGGKDATTGGMDATGGGMDATTTTDGGMTPDAGGGGPPAAPALGAQIDRMGRPAINTALTDPFNNDKPSQDAHKDA